MISFQPPPSRFLGSVATPIHTPAFNCFVSTARRFFISRQWETMIFLGDPGVKGFSARMRFFYCPGFNPRSIWTMHDVFCLKLDEKGEAGEDLIDAVADIVNDLINRGIVQNPLEPGTRK